MHGLGGWFDIDFQGSDPEKKVVLSTAPTSREPIGISAAYSITSLWSTRVRRFVSLHLVNEKYSYCIKMTASIDGTNISTSSDINLHDQIDHHLYTPQVEGAFTGA